MYRQAKKTKNPEIFILRGKKIPAYALKCPLFKKITGWSYYYSAELVEELELGDPTTLTSKKTPEKAHIIKTLLDISREREALFAEQREFSSLSGQLKPIARYDNLGELNYYLKSAKGKTRDQERDECPICSGTCGGCEEILTLGQGVVDYVFNTDGLRTLGISNLSTALLRLLGDKGRLIATYNDVYGPIKPYAGQRVTVSAQVTEYPDFSDPTSNKTILYCSLSAVTTRGDDDYNKLSI